MPVFQADFDGAGQYNPQLRQMILAAEQTDPDAALFGGINAVKSSRRTSICPAKDQWCLVVLRSPSGKLAATFSAMLVTDRMSRPFARARSAGANGTGLNAARRPPAPTGSSRVYLLVWNPPASGLQTRVPSLAAWQ